jgi:hypothetical protein
MHTRPISHERGSVIVISVVFMGVFAILLASLLEYLLVQHRWVAHTTEKERALQIAEAGIEYYRWRLAHFPNDITDGTGGPGPYVHTFDDPEEGPIGEFSLQVGGEVLCGQAQVVIATSTGYTYNDPTNTRTIVVRIARPTVADYSYLVDANVWAGSSRTIIGPYHSNGVVRMDANNQSVVTSKVDTTSCSGAGLGGCSGTINGVYGAGTNPQWWRWAQPDISFSNFDFDFGEMEDLATSDGIYLPKISNDTSIYGYYLELKANKTVDIYRVTSVSWVTSETPGSQTISFPELLGSVTTKRQFIENRAIPQSCPLIYASDRTWLEGQVGGKVTVVANDVGAASPDLFLQDNITYSTSSGADGLTVLAERNLLIPLYVPDNMTISGIYFAQKGSYGRPHYGSVSSTYNPYRTQSSLTTNGTVVSKLRTGTQWSDGQGFTTRNDYYDRNLAKSPPPLTPFTSPDFRFIEWREVR